jgi:hypothetical protein
MQQKFLTKFFNSSNKHRFDKCIIQKCKSTETVSVSEIFDELIKQIINEINMCGGYHYVDSEIETLPEKDKKLFELPEIDGFKKSHKFQTILISRLKYLSEIINKELKIKEESDLESDSEFVYEPLVFEQERFEFSIKNSITFAKDNKMYFMLWNSIIDIIGYFDENDYVIVGVFGSHPFVIRKNFKYGNSYGTGPRIIEYSLHESDTLTIIRENIINYYNDFLNDN